MDKRSPCSRRVLLVPDRRKALRAQPVGFPTFELAWPHQRLRRLQRWVAAHGALHLTLKEAARVAALEPHHFSATFHLCVGVTFGQWIREYRAALAVRALKCGRYSIAQVVEFVGYQDRRSLERSVKRTTGKTLAEIQQEIGT